MQDLVFRPATLGDIDGIVANKNEVLQLVGFDENTARSIYLWGLNGNPYRQERFPIGFVLENSGKIVGSVVLLPALFRINGENTYACFEIDIMVQQSFRFHGLKFYNKIWGSPLFPLVISTTPNRNSFLVEEKFGAKAIDFTKSKYVRVISVDKFFLQKRKIKVKYILAAIWRGLTDLANSFRMKEVFKVEEVRKFDDSFTAFYGELEYSVMHVRDSSYLNWRYFEFPIGERKIYSVKGANGKLRGFIVIQIEEERGIKKASVIDLVTKKEDKRSVMALLDLAIRFAEEKGLSCVEIIPPSAIVKNILLSRGFIPGKLRFPAHSFKYNGGKSSAILSTIEDPRNWYISVADGDSAIAALYRDMAAEEQHSKFADTGI